MANGEERKPGTVLNRVLCPLGQRESVSKKEWVLDCVKDAEKVPKKRSEDCLLALAKWRLSRTWVGAGEG